MKKLVFLILILVLIIGGGIFIFYKYYFPDFVANAIVKEETPPFVPVYMQRKFEKFKAPVNRASEDIINQMHKSHLTLEQIFKAIDETDEEQVHAALGELTLSEVKTTNQAFDVFKRHFRADFDVEVLREPFNRNVNMKMINKAIDRANAYRDEEVMDPEMAKAVIKKILLQKEKEYQEMLGGN
jgi:hypothetical protein